MPPVLTSLVACLAILLALVLTAMVGKARGKYAVNAPATTGHPEFEKLHRAHANTVEQLVLFLPSLMFFGIMIDSKIAAMIGVVWLAGRLYYVRSYLRDPASRGPGVVLTIVPTAVLLVGSIVALVMQGVAWL